MKILKFAILGAIVGLFFAGCAHTRASGSVVYDSGSPYYRGYYDSDYYYDRVYRRRPIIYSRRPVIYDRRPVIVDRRPVVIRDNHRHNPPRHINQRPHIYPHAQNHTLKDKSIHQARRIHPYNDNGERSPRVQRVRNFENVSRVKNSQREIRSYNDSGERYRSRHREIRRKTR